MTWAKGSKAQLIFDEETTYKSDPATINGRVIPFVRESIASKRNLIESVSITADRNRKSPSKGNLDISGEIEVELSDTAFSWLLKHLLGSVTTTGTADPYTHTLKVGALPVGLVIEKGFTDIGQYFKFNGCRIAGATFNIPTEGICTATFRIAGAKETVSTTPYDSTPTSYSHVPFTSAMVTPLEGGAAINNLKEVTISIDNDLDTDGYTLGSGGERRELPEGFAIVTGELVYLFEDVTLYNKALNLTESSLKITMDRGVTPARSIEILLPEIVYEPNAPVIESPKGIIVRQPFRAYYDNAPEGTSFQIVIKNGLSSL